MHVGIETGAEQGAEKGLEAAPEAVEAAQKWIEVNHPFDPDPHDYLDWTDEPAPADYYDGELVSPAATTVETSGGAAAETVASTAGSDLVGGTAAVDLSAASGGTAVTTGGTVGTGVLAAGEQEVPELLTEGAAAAGSGAGEILGALGGPLVGIVVGTWLDPNHDPLCPVIGAGVTVVGSVFTPLVGITAGIGASLICDYRESIAAAFQGTTGSDSSGGTPATWLDEHPPTIGNPTDGGSPAPTHTADTDSGTRPWDVQTHPATTTGGTSDPDGGATTDHLTPPTHLEPVDPNHPAFFGF